MGAAGASLSSSTLVEKERAAARTHETPSCPGSLESSLSSITDQWLIRASCFVSLGFGLLICKVEMMTAYDSLICRVD